jgi:hypothetical protein
MSSASCSRGSVYHQLLLPPERLRVLRWLRAQGTDSSCARCRDEARVGQPWISDCRHSLRSRHFRADLGTPGFLRIASKSLSRVGKDARSAKDPAARRPYCDQKSCAPEIRATGHAGSNANNTKLRQLRAPTTNSIIKIRGLRSASDVRVACSFLMSDDWLKRSK